MMNDQKKTVVVSLLATIALGAGGYFVFGNSRAATGENVQAETPQRGQRVAETEPSPEHGRPIRTMPAKGSRETLGRRRGADVRTRKPPPRGTRDRGRRPEKKKSKQPRRAA